MTPRGQRLVILVGALAGTALTARLGWWQLDRAAQRQHAQAALDSRRALPPLVQRQLAHTPEQALEQHQRRVVLQGRWHAESIYLDNRQMRGLPGFYVLTPLLLDDGSAVLVQRGWMPRDPADRARITVQLQGDAEVSVQGHVAPPPPRLYEFGPSASGPIRQNLDLPSFARETSLSLRSLSVVQDEPVPALNDGLLRQWPQPAAGLHKHYGYAFQWFSLSALILGLYVWFQLIQPRRSKRA